MIKELTPKQESFAQAVASGLTQSDAYRKAYTVSPTTKPESVNQLASTMMGLVHISSRVKELRDQLSEKALWTREDSVRTLLEVIGNPDKQTDIITAVKELNAMHGFNAPQKIDHLSSDKSMAPVAVVVDKAFVKSVLEKWNDEI